MNKPVCLHRRAAVAAVLASVVLLGGCAEVMVIGTAANMVAALPSNEPHWVETNRLTNPNDPNAIVDDLSRLCFGIPPSPQVRSLMLQTLLQGAQPGEWSMNLPNAPERLHDLYVLAMRLPEYQLK